MARLGCEYEWLVARQRRPYEECAMRCVWGVPRKAGGRRDGHHEARSTCRVHLRRSRARALIRVSSSIHSATSRASVLAAFSSFRSSILARGGHSFAMIAVFNSRSRSCHASVGPLGSLSKEGTVVLGTKVAMDGKKASIALLACLSAALPLPAGRRKGSHPLAFCTSGSSRQHLAGDES